MTGDLAARFRRLISLHGPITVARFMGESNAQYYATRDPLGAPKASMGGDFVTAPEISQMFGELVGLWLADAWDRAGRPAEAVYAELGPGRGTLTTDALRAMSGVGLAPQLHLVEGSPTLSALQGEAMPQAEFHEDASSLPEGGPLLLVANEFLDALPIRQLVHTPVGWRERVVALDGERLVFAAGPQSMDLAVPEELAGSSEGTIIETCPGAAAVLGEVAQRLAKQGGAALFVDYGHLAPRTGSTLQAVRAHRKIDALASPGEADLTAHVDFATLAKIAQNAGCRVQTATQGEWLTAMGIDLRAATLARKAPDRAGEIAQARDRLAAPEAMGALFKVMAFTAPSWEAGAGFS